MATIPKFRYAPRDERSDDERSALREVVRKQIEPWVAEMAADAKAAAVQGMTILRNRRGGAGVTAFELDDDQYPVAPYRLLVRRDDADGVVVDLTGEYAPQVVPIPELEYVRVLQDIGAGKQRLRNSGAVARTVPDGRAAASYVVLLGAVRKAVGGPEPSPPPTREFSRAAGLAVRDPGPFVVIIDNGVSAEVRGDGWLAGLARSDNLDLLNVVPLDEYLDLGAGHGTFTAGIVQQVAPRVRLDVRRALDTEGVGDEVDIGREIIRAAEDGAEIINLSLGLVTTDGRPPRALETAIRSAIRVAHEKHRKHLLLVCAAGNYGDKRPCWPAAFAREPGFEGHVISVAALRRDYVDPAQVVGAEWSTHGKRVTISTFGQGVASTYVVGKESREYDPSGPDTFVKNSWATWSGTSFAAPQVTGAIVRIMQETGVPTAHEAFERLLGAGTRVIPGYGISIEILPV
jgi:subtilisin family serine protease